MCWELSKKQGKILALTGEAVPKGYLAATVGDNQSADHHLAVSACYNASMLLLNQPVPDFELPDLSGHMHRLSAYRGRIVVANFWSAECPWSERTDRYLVASMHQQRGQVVYLPIAANVNETLETMWAAASQRALPIVLRDAAAALADRWGAQTTPHAFVIDAQGYLRYTGAVDNTTFRQKTPTRWYVEEAVDALLAGRQPELQEAAPYGCTIVRT